MAYLASLPAVIETETIHTLALVNCTSRVFVVVIIVVVVLYGTSVSFSYGPPVSVAVPVV